MNVTIRVQIQAQTKPDIEQAFNRLDFERVGLNIEAHHTIRKVGKEWIGEQIITTTPDESYEVVLAGFMASPANGWHDE